MGLAVVPDDWSEGYVELCVKWPASEQWQAILRGLLTSPNDAEFWDKFTGDVDDPKIAILPTFNQNLHLEECMKFLTGMIVMWPNENPPSGWLLYNNQSVGKSDYPALYEFLGGVFGETEFDFLVGPPPGRFPIGWDECSAYADPVYNYGGEAEHTLTADEMPAHAHVQDVHSHIQDAHSHIQDAHAHADDRGVTWGTGAHTANNTYYTLNSNQGSIAGALAKTNATATNQNATATNQNATATNQNAGGGEAHNNLPPYFVINFIIKT